MDGRTLSEAMGGVVSLARYNELAEPFTAAMRQAGCTTTNRAAMWCAQIGHESVGLKYVEEIASGAAYEGRKDLGNTQPGDGKRFKGRGPIQLTGRSNYGAFSRWCRDCGLVDSPDYFVRNPTLVAQPRWGFLAASWYWTVARARLNSYADAGDILAATKAINGGTNGLADRTARWTRCRAMGPRLLPTTTAPQEDAELNAEERAMLTAVYQQLSGSAKAGEWPGWPTWAGGTDEKLTLVDYARRGNVEARQAWLEVQALRRELAELRSAVDALGGQR